MATTLLYLAVECLPNESEVMVNLNKFGKKTKEELAKRANNKCSSPLCTQITSGPHSVDDKSVNIGVAAHIKGANPGSARYDENMQPKERSSITNGIWLCHKCAKMIDNDASRYPVALLAKWKFDHETEISSAVQTGMTPTNYEIERLKKVFFGESFSALQIALDKPKEWRFLLARELLREKANIQKRRARLVFEEHVFKPHRVLRENMEISKWLMAKNLDIFQIVQMFNSLTGKIFFLCADENSDSSEILEACCLFEEACEHLINWWQDIKSTHLIDELDFFHSEMIESTQTLISMMEAAPEWFGEIIAGKAETYAYGSLDELFDPQGYGEIIKRAIAVLAKKFYK